ncbi:hypothetical protein LB505_008826 [Fusarium chuoi]|nr:hypothetical protein LB505_008826 [Fusarium chuoi]
MRNLWLVSKFSSALYGLETRRAEEGGLWFNRVATDPKLLEPVTSDRMPTPEYASGASSPLSEAPPSHLIHTPSSPLSEPPSDIDEISLNNWDDLHEASSSSSEGAETPASRREWE